VIHKQLNWVVEAAKSDIRHAFEIEIAYDEVGKGGWQDQDRRGIEVGGTWAASGASAGAPRLHLSSAAIIAF
jgi:hypothetical protein